MNKERVIFSSIGTEISESKDGNFYDITTQLCYGGSQYNLNGIALDFTSLDDNVKTLKDTPVVAYMDYGSWGEEDEFGGHGAYVDWDGELRFMSSSIGHTTSVSVETQRLKPVYSQLEMDLPVIKCTSRIYASRFPEYSKVLKRMLMDGELGVSWELETTEVEYKEEDLEGIPNPRIATAYEFLGYALIGVPPAYGSMAKVLEISEISKADDINKQLSEALKKDIENQQSTSKKDDDNKKDKSERSEQVEGKLKELQNQLDIANAKIEEFENANKDSEIAELKAENETLKAEKTEVEEKLVKASKSVETLSSQVDELKPYKEKIDVIETEKAEAEKVAKVAELKSMVTKGGYVEESELESNEEIVKMISELDEDGLKVLRAERILDKLDVEDSKVETREKDQDVEKKVFSEENKNVEDVMGIFLEK